MELQPPVDDILQKLYSLHRFGIKPGLKRTRELLASVGNPQTAYPTVHVAGTNGKGTTCSIIASVLQSFGYRVGLYTSPHIVRFNERIRVDREMISDNDLARLAIPLLAKSAEEYATFFELTTVLAFEYFREKKIDIAVVETGLGGRLDSTNVITPLVSVITSIDLDHTDYLGSTIESIAYEKAGIIKSGIPVVVGERKSEALKVIEQRAQKKLSDVIDVDVFYHEAKSEIDELLDDFSLIGDVARRNCCIALAALDSIHGQFPVSREAKCLGLKNLVRNTGLIGRLHVVSDIPLTIVDVSHNPSGVGAAVSNLRKQFSDTQFHVIFSAMKDKDVEGMLESLLSPEVEKSFAKSITFVDLKLDRSALPAELLAMGKRVIGESGQQCLTTSISFAEGYERAIRTESPTLVIGSFYLAEEAYRYFENKT